LYYFPMNRFTGLWLDVLLTVISIAIFSALLEFLGV